MYQRWTLFPRPFQLPRVIIYWVDMMSWVQQVECRGRGGGAAVNDSREPEFLPAANGHHRGGSWCCSSNAFHYKTYNHHHHSQSLLGVGGSSPPAATFPMLLSLVIVIMSYWSRLSENRDYTSLNDQKRMTTVCDHLIILSSKVSVDNQKLPFKEEFPKIFPSYHWRGTL